MNLDLSDITLVLFAFICIWMIISMTGGTGGGHRARVPAF